MVLTTKVFPGFQISDENSVCPSIVKDRVVTGNHEKMGYECVHWIHLVHD